MSRSLTIFLTCISLCSLSLGVNRVLGQEKRSCHLEIGDVPVEDSVPGRTIYRVDLIIHGQSMSLMLVMKSLPGGECRAALINELGMGFMNASLRQEGNRIKLRPEQIHPLLDHRWLVRRLKRGILIKAAQCCFPGSGRK